MPSGAVAAEEPIVAFVFVSLLSLIAGAGSGAGVGFFGASFVGGVVGTVDSGGVTGAEVTGFGGVTVVFVLFSTVTETFKFGAGNASFDTVIFAI